VNAYWFATITITVIFVVFICRVATLVDREADRRAAFRWEERFYQPGLPVRRGRVIDVQTRNAPRPSDRGAKRADLPAPRVPAEFR
jgi:hypothetical protein